jgi:Tol biopolymer transport system component
MLTPTLIARGAVFSPATSRDGQVMAWSNRKNGTRDIFVRRNEETFQLTHDSEVDTEPALTPDGEVLIWSRRTGQDWDLYQAIDGHIEPLIEEPGPQRKPQISADGSTLVFEDRDGVGVVRNGEREWIAPPAGTEVSRRPLVSADGSRVFWERFDQSTRTNTLWMRDQNGNEKPLLTPDDSWTGYNISRNGQQVTYSVWTDKGEDLHVWDLDTNQRSPVADKEDVNESFPSVSEDGSTTYYTLSDFRGYPKVNTYIFRDQDGKKDELVTRDPVGRNLFSRVTSDGNLLHWMWIDDNDPNNRALFAASVNETNAS